MKLVDANVLLYATNAEGPQHAPCRAWLEAALNASEPIGFAWVVLLAFLRLSTKAQVFEAPLTPQRAMERMRAWLASPVATVVVPGDRHLTLLEGLLVAVGTGGNLTSDAHLAALALEHGASIVSCDADFARFSGVAHFNPLR